MEEFNPLYSRSRSSKSKSEKDCRINEEITGTSVRLVGDGEPEVVSLSSALDLARSKDLDLVEISSGQDMPVVKIMDYRKYKFEQLKKAKEAKKKQKVVHVKEVKVRPAIDDHDYEHKIKHAREFLEKGDKVKFTMMFRGREIVHAELGKTVMEKIIQDLSDCIVIEAHPSIQGRNMTMVLAPGSGSKPKKAETKDGGEENA